MVKRGFDSRGSDKKHHKKLRFFYVALVVLAVALFISLDNFNDLDKIQFSPEPDSGLVLSYNASSLIGTRNANAISIYGRDNLSIGQNFNDFIPIFNFSYLPTVLDKGAITGKNNERFDYSQKIIFSDQFKLRHTPNSNAKSSIALSAGSGKVFDYSLNFEINPESSLIGNRIKMLGREYYIFSYNSGSKLILFENVTDVAVLNVNLSTSRSSGFTSLEGFDVSINPVDVSDNQVSLYLNSPDKISISKGSVVQVPSYPVGSLYAGIESINITGDNAEIKLVIGKGKIELSSGANLKLNEDLIEDYRFYLNQGTEFKLEYFSNVTIYPGSSWVIPVFETFGLNLGEYKSSFAQNTTIKSTNGLLYINATLASGAVEIPILFYNKTSSSLVSEMPSGKTLYSSQSNQMTYSLGEELLERQTDLSPNKNSPMQINGTLFAQTFTGLFASSFDESYIYKISVPVFKIGCITADCTVDVTINAVKADGNPDVNNILARVGTIDEDFLETSPMWKNFTFSPIFFDPNQVYALVMNVTSSSTGNSLAWSYSQVTATDSYPNGKAIKSTDDGVTWAEVDTNTAKEDFGFRIFGYSGLDKGYFVVSGNNSDSAESYFLEALSFSKNAEGADVLSFRNIINNQVSDVISPQPKAFGNVSLSFIRSLDGEYVVLAANSLNGGSASFNRIYTKEGLEITLPSYSASNGNLQIKDSILNGRRGSLNLAININNSGSLLLASTLLELNDSSGNNVSYLESEHGTKVIRNNEGLVISSSKLESYSTAGIYEIVDRLYYKDSLRDLSSSGVPAFLVGPTIVQDGGKSIKFNGAGDYVSVQRSNFLSDVVKGSYSIYLSYVPETISSGEKQGLFIISNVTSSNDALYPTGLSFESDGTSSGKFVLSHYEGKNLKIARSANTFETGSKYFVVGVVDRTNNKLRVYVNGLLEVEFNTSLSSGAFDYSSTGSNWKLGVVNERSSDKKNAKGNIEFVKLWNRALSPAEVVSMSGMVPTRGSVSVIIPANCQNQTINSTWNSIFSKAYTGGLIYTSDQVAAGSCNNYLAYQQMNGEDLLLAGSSRSVNFSGSIYEILNVSALSTILSDGARFSIANASSISEANTAYAGIDSSDSSLRQTSILSSDLASVKSIFNSSFGIYPQSSSLVSIKDSLSNVIGYEYAYYSFGGVVNISIDLVRNYARLNFDRSVLVYSPCTPVYSWSLSACSNDRIINYSRITNSCQASLPDNQTIVSDCEGNRILGRFSEVNRENVNLKYTIDNNEANDTAIYSGVKKIRFSDSGSSNVTRVSFDFNFTSGAVLDLRNVKVSKQPSSAKRGYLIVNGLSFNKTFVVDKVNSSSNSVCIKDRDGLNVDDISDSCGFGYERLVDCDGLYDNGYICSIVNNTFVVSGLTNSAVKEFLPQPAPTTSGPSTTSSSSSSSSSTTSNSGTTGTTYTPYTPTTSGPSTTSSSSSSSSSTTSNSSKTIIWIIIAVLILAIIVVVGFILFYSRKSDTGGVVIHTPGSGYHPPSVSGFQR